MIGSTLNQIVYLGNGSTSTHYPIEFRFDDAAWIRVTIKEPGVASYDLDEDEFTVTHAEDGTGYFVTGTAYDSSTTVTVTRLADGLQSLSLENSETLDAHTLEMQLDQLSMAVIDRASKADLSEVRSLITEFEPAAFVASVNGRAGTVTLNSSDILDATSTGVAGKLVKLDESGNAVIRELYIGSGAERVALSFANSAVTQPVTFSFPDADPYGVGWDQQVLVSLPAARSAAYADVFDAVADNVEPGAPYFDAVRSRFVVAHPAIPYGEISVSGNTVAQAIPTGGAATKINAFVNQSSVYSPGVTPSADDGEITLTKPGIYKIEATFSTKTDTSNTLLHTNVSANGSALSTIGSTRMIQTIGAESTNSIGGILRHDGTEPVVLAIVVHHDRAGTVNLTVRNANLNVYLLQPIKPV